MNFLLTIKRRIISMKTKRNLLITILAITIIFVLGLITVIIVKNKDSKNNVYNNLNEQVISTKEVSNIVFTNIKYEYKDNMTIVSMKILNKNDKSVKLNNFIVKAYDETKNIIGTFNPYVDGEIESNKSNNISFSIKEDYSKANSMEIELPELEFIER